MTTHPLVEIFLAVAALYWARSLRPGVPLAVAPAPAANVGWPTPSHRKSTSAPMGNAAALFCGSDTVMAAALDRVTIMFSSASTGV